MSDGYSDKSVTPITYQPAADNDPQAVSDRITESINGIVDKAMISIGATLAPITPMVPVSNSLGIAASALTSGVGAAMVLDNGNVLFAAGTNLYLWDKTTETATLFCASPTGVAVTFLLNLGSGVYLAFTSYKISRSTDYGANWSLVYTDAVTSCVIAKADNNGNTICAAFLGGTNGSNDGFIVRSTDGGKNWTKISARIATELSVAGGIRYCTGNTWLAFFGSYNSTSLVFLKSTDNGENWVIKTSPASQYIDSHMICYLGGNIAICGSRSGVFKTTDLGETWNLIASSVLNLYTMIHLGSGVVVSLYNYKAYVSTDYGDTFTVFSPDSGSFTWAINVGGYCKLSATEFMWFLVSQTAFTVGTYRVKLDQEYFVTLPSFSVTAPAKLSAILTATAQLVTAGKSGTVKLYLQHTNDAVTAASSLADVAGAWTDCGALTHDTPLSLPSFTARAGEVIYPRLGFTCTDATGVSPAPELSSIAFAWTSDVTAPGEPTVTRIVNTSGASSYGYRVDFGDLPATARHLIVEGSKNAAAYVPFNNKAQWAAGVHMKLRGSRDAVEEAGERNETSLSSNTGFVSGDTAQVKVAAEDDLGNRSAFVESEVITMSSAVPIDFVPVLTRSVTAQIRKRLKATMRS